MARPLSRSRGYNYHRQRDNTDHPTNNQLLHSPLKDTKHQKLFPIPSITTKLFPQSKSCQTPHHRPTSINKNHPTINFTTTVSPNRLHLYHHFSHNILFISCSHIILLCLIFSHYFKHYSTSLKNPTSFITDNLLCTSNIKTIPTSKICNSVTSAHNLSKIL